jgi:hypothetical protein
MRAVTALIAVLFFLHFANPVSAAIQFNIGDAILSDTEINLTASISGLNTSSCSSEGKCYFQGVLRRAGSSYYFGQTQNNTGSWIDYISSPELEYIQSAFYSFQPNSGSWSGQLKMRFFTEDTEYKGPGDYELKFRRFSGNSKNPSGESNSCPLILTALLPTPTFTPTPSPTAAPTSAPTPTPTKTPTPTPTPTLKPSTSPTPKEIDVLGESTKSGEIILPTDVQSSSEDTLISNQSKDESSSWFQKISIFIGIVFIVSCGILTFREIRKRKLMQDE